MTVDIDARIALGHERDAFAIDEHRLGFAIFEHIRDRLCGQTKAHRHGHQTCAHDAQIGEQELDAVLRKDGHAIAAHQTAPQQPSRHRVGCDVQLAERPLTRVRPQIDQADDIEHLVGGDHIAEIIGS